MNAQLEQLCSELGTLCDEESRQAFLREHPEIAAEQTVADLAEAIRTAVRVDLSRACSLAEAAVTIAASLSRDEPLGLALRAKANALWFLGNCREAVSLFDDAAALLERAGNLSEVGRTLSSSIQSRALLGNYEDAYEAARKAREIFQSLGETLRLARLDINVANILHRQNRYADALRTYEHAYQELLPHKDKEAISVALHNIAVCLIALDDYDRAQATYSRVRDLCEQNDMPLLVGQAEYNIAYLHHLRGEYSRALELLRATREKCEKNGDHYHLGLCDLDASGIYLDLNLVPEAAEAAASALAQFEKLGMNYEVVRSLLNLALAISRQGDLKRALELFARARELAVREENEILPALIDLEAGLALFERSPIQDVRQLCLRAQEVFRKAGSPSKEVTCRLLLGRIALSSGDLADARDHAETALHMLNSLDSPELLYQAQLLQGQIMEAVGDSAEAYRWYQAARSSLEGLRSGLGGDELKIGFMRQRIGVYTSLVRLCLHGDNPALEEAFAYIEASKSRTLQELVVSGPQPHAPSFDGNGMAKRAGDLRRTLNWYYNRLRREQFSADRISKDRLERLRAQSLACERELHRLWLESPAQGRAEFATRSIAGVAEIRHELGGDVTLLEYFTADGQIYAVVLSARHFRIVSLAKVSEIVPPLRMLEFQLSKFRLDRAYARRFEAPLLRSIQAHLKTLFEKLIAPIDDMLATSKLVIVPAGQLHSLPFQALFDGENYLVDRFTICYALSANVFAYSHQLPSAESEVKSLIIGVQDPQMPSIKEEIEAVATVLPNPLVLWGPEATEQNLRKYGSTSNLIHIASHGYFRADSPMFSAIRLADSFLTLHDLYQMNLPAEFLALSGCVTGLNVVDAGEELIGLTRGLLYAGARSLLLSLWDVDDSSTSAFMRSFYTELSRGSSQAGAIRHAMIDLRRTSSHPYFWAPFKLSGGGFN